MKKRSFTKEKLPEIAKAVIIAAQKNKKTEATVVTLSGELGAGKTTLTQQIARELGAKEQITSPTFVLMKQYKLPKLSTFNFQLLTHVDAYRIEKNSELEKLGWNELISNPNNIVIIEWPEQVPGLIPKHALNVSLTHKNTETREISW